MKKLKIAIMITMTGLLGRTEIMAKSNTVKTSPALEVGVVHHRKVNVK